MNKKLLKKIDEVLWGELMGYPWELYCWDCLKKNWSLQYPWCVKWKAWACVDCWFKGEDMWLIHWWNEKKEPYIISKHLLEKAIDKIWSMEVAERARSKKIWHCWHMRDVDMFWSYDSPDDLSLQIEANPELETYLEEVFNIN